MINTLFCRLPAAACFTCPQLACRLKKAEKIGLRKINVSNSKKTHPYPLPGSEFVAANHLVPDHADNFAIGKFAFESLGAI